jgi:hypothetical protein
VAVVLEAQLPGVGRLVGLCAAGLVFIDHQWLLPVPHSAIHLPNPRSQSTKLILTHLIEAALDVVKYRQVLVMAMLRGRFTGSTVARQLAETFMLVFLPVAALTVERREVSIVVLPEDEADCLCPEFRVHESDEHLTDSITIQDLNHHQQLICDRPLTIIKISNGPKIKQCLSSGTANGRNGQQNVTFPPICLQPTGDLQLACERQICCIHWREHRFAPSM